MKRTTIHISAALALLLAAAACTQDEAGFLPEGAKGTPIVFTATGLNPTATATAGTRAPVDGNWEGVTSVDVMIDGEVKAYNVTPSTSDNTGATLTSDEPYYWTNHNNITVTAWWPYTEGETTPPAVKVAADQSVRKDFEGSDLIVAEEQTVSYGNPTLRFIHRTARVTVILTDYTEEQMFVWLTGLSTENGNPAVIAPHDKGGDTYTALVAPQSVATGTAFITCKFTNGKVFVYKMKNDADWQAGKEYTYTVSLAAAKDPGYTVSEDGKTYTVTSADGLLAWNEAVQKDMTLNCTLANNIDLTGKDWTPIGTSFGNSYTGTFDGNGKTITGLTVTVSDRYAGLFGRIGSGGTVQNVVLEGVQMTSDNSWGYVGGVAGYSEGNIENCSVSGSVSGSFSVGGVVGHQWGGTITGCSSSATVNAGIVAGGIAGETNGGASLTACYATGDVTVENDGTSYACAGGVVGYNGGSSTLTACYAAGSVTGKGSGTIYAGGVTGENFDGTLTACYATGSVTGSGSGTIYVGGVTGTNDEGTLTACYATGSVTGSGSGTIYVGGVTGTNDEGTLTACYHANGTVSGPAGTTGGVTGRNYKFFNDPVITACYWGDNGQEEGIGKNQAGTTFETTKVDGDWQNAVTQMNAALSGKGWQYELKDGNSLPALKKKQ